MVSETGSHTFVVIILVTSLRMPKGYIGMYHSLINYGLSLWYIDIHRSEYVTMWLGLSWGSNLCSTLHIPIGLAIYPNSGHSEWLFRFALEISSNIMGLVTHGGGLMMMLAGPYYRVYIYIYTGPLCIYICIYMYTYIYIFTYPYTHCS